VRSIFPLLFVAVVVAGCAERRAEIVAKRAAEDDAKCVSYGAKPGDPAYVQCRTQLDAARTQANAIEAAAPPPAPYTPPNDPANPFTRPPWTAR
jgi:hypothetical protein